jgi:hypothetical protein
MQKHTVWTVFLQQLFKPPALHQNTGAIMDRTLSVHFRSARAKARRSAASAKICDIRASYGRLRGLSPKCADDLCADMVQTDLCQAQGLLKLPIEWRGWPATRRHLRTIIHIGGQENGIGDQDVKRDEKDAAAFTTLV